MSTAETESEAPLTFTATAAAKVAELVAEQDNPNLNLRVYIEGGGCSGMSYCFSFDENADEDDAKVVTNGIMLLIDPMSLMYLMGAEIDYVDNLQGSQFVVTNPNAATTCGCGSSFSV